MSTLWGSTFSGYRFRIWSSTHLFLGLHSRGSARWGSSLLGYEFWIWSSACLSFRNKTEDPSTQTLLRDRCNLKVQNSPTEASESNATFIYPGARASNKRPVKVLGGSCLVFAVFACRVVYERPFGADYFLRIAREARGSKTPSAQHVFVGLFLCYYWIGAIGRRVDLSRTLFWERS